MNRTLSAGRVAATAMLLLFSGLLLFFARAAVTGAADGLILCGCTVIPSLFPFFVLSNLLIRLGFGTRLSKLLEKPFRRLFGVSSAGVPAFLFGILGGYPLGAKTVASLYGQKQLSRQDAERLLLFCNNTGPSFFVGAVGLAVFGSPAAGLLLYGVHVLSAVLTGMLLNCFRRQSHSRYALRPVAVQPQPFGTAFSDAVLAACQSMLGISAFVVFFSALTAVLEQTQLTRLLTGALCRFLPVSQHLLQSLLLGGLEMTSGVMSLTGVGTTAAFCLSAAIVSWGGLCIRFQSAAQLAGTDLSLRGYGAAKLLQASIAGLLALPASQLYLHLSGSEQAASARSVCLLPMLVLLAVFVFAKIVQKRGGIYRRNPV